MHQPDIDICNNSNTDITRVVNLLLLSVSVSLLFIFTSAVELLIALTGHFKVVLF